MASTYLNKTFSSAGNRKTWTFSTWFKRGNLGSRLTFFSGKDGSYPEGLNINTSNQFEYDHDISGTDYTLTSDMLFRDVNAWYHLVVTKDTTQATEADRLKVYVNGNQITLNEVDLGYPPQNYDGAINNSVNHFIGNLSSTDTYYFDGIMAHTHFIDGTAYAASDFGETDATTGIWKPKTAPSVTYGTNGFFLKFENSGSMGTDSSGNANNFTVNGTLTQTEDTPSNVFATYNSLIATKGQTFSNGNLSVATTTTNVVGGFSTIGVSKGKYYAEFKITAGSTDRGVVGIADNPSEQDRNNTIIGSSTYSYSYYGETGYKVNNSSGSAYGDTYTLGDIVGVALDLDNNYIYFSKNGTWQNSGDPTSGSSGTGAAYNITAASGTGTGFYHIGVGDDSGTYAHTIAANFGNGYFGTTAVSSANADDNGIGAFEYAPPTGYLALCTKNINAQEYS